LIKGLDVVGGAEKAEFLARPPREADGVGGAVVGELDGGFEDADCAAAVVVDARASVDAIGVGSKLEDGVLVASDCLGDDIEAVEWY
jgi:hypothetical protein